ncbi:MAG: hypothetical protein JST19_19380 [Bacteroidetes bacterium]|nr:hypothetical protein [Bacteroidota bacterium]
MAEIKLWLDSYEDIYSDFDSRHYLNRRISEDFLHELHTETKYLEQHAGDMILLLPREQRNEETEKIITNSLANYFRAQFLFHHDKCRHKLVRGVLFLIMGVGIMLLNSWIIYRSGESFTIIGLRVLLEPAGWFSLWAGLDFLLYDFAGLKKEETFYQELSEMHIHFQSS